MKQLLLILFVLLVGMNALAGELRVWNLANGNTIEAEWISMSGDKVTLKQKHRKLIKIPLASFSEQDQAYIELSMPPTLEINFSKKTKTFKYAPLTQRFEIRNIMPRSILYTFSTQIQQASAGPYKHDLTAEIFVMGVEVDGEKNILIDHHNEVFSLNNQNKRTVEIAGAENHMLTSYLASDGMWRGEKYAGYLIVVTDSRGEIVGYKTNREWWFEKIESLRKVPVGKTFNEEGSRCWPTRPKARY